MSIRTVIVDDEALARKRLRDLLAPHQDVEIVGEAANGRAAVSVIVAEKPDLVFLDVQMPDLDGFDVVERVVAEVDSPELPAVVFATAFDQFAVRAFEANAVDYLLKPIGPERLDASLARVRDRFGGGQRPGAEDGLVALLEQHAPASPAYRERFAVKSGNRFRIVRAAEITWIESADNYIRLYTPTGEHLLRSRMRDIESWLDPRHFLRVHRTSIINIDAVSAIEPWGLREYLFTMSDGKKVYSSRQYRAQIRTVFGC